MYATQSTSFLKKDKIRFQEYQQGLVHGKAKIHSEVLFPVDIVKNTTQTVGIIGNALQRNMMKFWSNNGKHCQTI